MGNSSASTSTKCPYNRINIQIIPVGCMRPGWRYGDYFLDEKGTLQVRVSEFDNHIDTLALVLHELNEAWLCAEKGIKFEAIDSFDLEHAETEDPGLLKCAPYHSEHMKSELIERLVCCQNDRDWNSHYDAEPIGD